jgi:periplasmic copper chaperone A
MTIKFLATLAIGAAALASCGQSGPSTKSDAAAMPTPTVSINGVDMPRGTQISTLSMINAKVKKPIEGRPTSAYLTIENGGPTAETITAVSSPDFGRVELNDHVKEGDMVKMVKLDTIDVPANSQVVFDQGGKHLMLFDATHPMNNGDSVKITLTFSNSGPIETNFVVLNEIPRTTIADPMAGHAMPGHDMPSMKKP